MPDMLLKLDDDLGKIIKTYLDADYTAFDSTGKIATGKKYQTVQLKDASIEGFRASGRGSFIRSLKARNSRILDIGSNLGELSRVAASGEGNLVYSFEYDPFFVRIAQVINAVSGSHNIVTRQVDIEKCDLQDEFDHILAFSVYRFIARRLPDLARSLKGLMLIETHNISSPDNLDAYWKDLKSHFPFVAQIGHTDHGKDTSGQRAMFVVSKSKERLWKYFFDLASSVDAVEVCSVLSLRASNFEFLSKFRQELEFIQKAQAAFSNGVCTTGSLPCDPAQVGSGALFSSEYWQCYVAGYFEFLSEGKVLPGNVYVEALRRALLLDAGFEVHIKSSLADLDAVIEKVARRFVSFQRMHKHSRGDAYSDNPVLLLRERGTSPAKDFKLNIDGVDMTGHAIDGYHRIFDAILLGIETLPVAVIEYDFSRSR